MDSTGELLAVALSSEKAFKKSRESGSLWYVNPETGRVLPLEGFGAIVDLKRAGSGVVARVEAAVGAPVAARAEAPAPGAQPRAEAPAPGAQPGGVLETLEGIIRSRQQEMKEGSYTTYLFEKGLEKIRKKTGEEAIELLLTTERKDTVNEAADLVYHLLVLLRALDIPLSEVLNELKKRLG
jgi:phosphoribosyl-ATP pyrophosphohydrolase